MKNEKISAPWHKNRNVCRVSKKQKRKNANKKFSFLLLFFSSFSSSSSPLFSFFFFDFEQKLKVGRNWRNQSEIETVGIGFYRTCGCRADVVRCFDPVTPVDGVRWQRPWRPNGATLGAEVKHHQPARWPFDLLLFLISFLISRFCLLWPRADYFRCPLFFCFLFVFVSTIYIYTYINIFFELKW